MPRTSSDAGPPGTSPPDRWTVYERCHPAVRAYAARRVEPDAVDDVVAETFAIAWRKLPREGDPLPWLYGVARKVVHGHRRSHARRSALLARVTSRGGSAASAAPDPAERVAGADPRLARALAALSPVEREAICLVAWEGLTGAAAARAAGCSENAFNVRLSRARAHLRDALAAPPAADLPPARGRAAAAASRPSVLEARP